MPDDTFRMLICGGSGSGKTNLLYHMLTEPLVFYDQIHLYAKNLEQEKYQNMIKKFDKISQSVGYDVLICSDNEIVPVENMESGAQKIIIFDDFHFCMSISPKNRTKGISMEISNLLV